MDWKSPETINGPHCLDMLAEAVYWYFENIYDGPGGDPSWVHEGREIIGSHLVPNGDARSRCDAVEGLFSEWSREARK